MAVFWRGTLLRGRSATSRGKTAANPHLHAMVGAPPDLHIAVSASDARIPQDLIPLQVQADAHSVTSLSLEPFLSKPVASCRKVPDLDRRTHRNIGSFRCSTTAKTSRRIHRTREKGSD